jgi:hypothetical protein
MRPAEWPAEWPGQWPGEWPAGVRTGLVASTGRGSP